MLVMANHQIGRGKHNSSLALEPCYLQSLRPWNQEEMDNGYNMWANFFVFLRNGPLYLWFVPPSCEHLFPCTPIAKTEYYIWGFTECSTSTFALRGWLPLTNLCHHLDGDCCWTQQDSVWSVCVICAWSGLYQTWASWNWLFLTDIPSE